jgi:hypothetical protein
MLVEVKEVVFCHEEGAHRIMVRWAGEKGWRRRKRETVYV